MKIKTLLIPLLAFLSCTWTTQMRADKKIYLPTEVVNGGDLNDTASTWCYQRSIQGDDIIIFWGKGYGANDPNSSAVPSAYRVDVKDMLAKLESFYDLNVNKLKFATVGKDSSTLDKYKMVILLYYTTDWMAYGGGFDYKVGGMWVSPSTCHPVGSTIAHEIGHSFQYQIYCDYLMNHPSYDSNAKSVAFQYQIGNGNSFWETTAQWQSYQAYPDQYYNPENYNAVFRTRCYYHPYHEWQRYANYFIIEWFNYKHGIDTPSRIWHECVSPEDPSQVYMRLFYGGYSNISQVNSYSDELYDMAAHWVTWDIPSLRTYGQDHIGDITTTMDRGDLDSEGHQIWKVDSANCIQEHGFNHIELNVPTNGGNITAYFKGIAGEAGYRNVDAVNAGWRFGFVALLNDGTRVYSPVNSATHKAPTDTVSFNVPANTSRLWMVVLGAPSRVYRVHKWDEDASNDEQWPYQVSFKNTNLLGMVSFDSDETAHNATISYDINLPVSVSTGDYQIMSFKPDMTPVCHAFLMQPDEIWNNLGRSTSTKSVRFYNLNADGTQNTNYTTATTTDNWGGWFDKSGNLCSWGSTSIIYNDLNLTNKTFTLGRYPNAESVGQKITFKQAMVYKRKYQVTFKFNISFVASTEKAEITATNVTTDGTSSINAITTSANRAQSGYVYDLQGRVVSVNGITNLPKGIYITEGKKVVK